MRTGGVLAIEGSVYKTNEWLSDLAAELGVDRAEAWRILRAFLQLVRDRLTLDEAAQFAAQLPHMLRGVFYEGFDPGHAPETFHDREGFLQRLAERAELAETTTASLAAEAAMRTVRRHVDGGELEEVLAQLSESIRSVLEPR